MVRVPKTAGVGDVIGEAMLSKDFVVERAGQQVLYLSVATASGASRNQDDPALAEWVVPIRWIATRSREEAVVDSDFFANQNSAVKLTHGNTLKRLERACVVAG